MGCFRARWFGDRDAEPLPLYAPDGVVQRLQGLEEDDEEAIQRIFNWHELAADQPYALGPWLLRSWWLPHFVPNAGVRLTAEGLTVAYTGDTGPDPHLCDSPTMRICSSPRPAIVGRAAMRHRQGREPGCTSQPTMPVPQPRPRARGGYSSPTSGRAMIARLRKERQPRSLTVRFSSPTRGSG